MYQVHGIRNGVTEAMSETYTFRDEAMVKLEQMATRFYDMEGVCEVALCDPRKTRRGEDGVILTRAVGAVFNRSAHYDQVREELEDMTSAALVVHITKLSRLIAEESVKAVRKRFLVELDAAQDVAIERMR